MDVKLSQVPFIRLFIPLAAGITTALCFPLHFAFIYLSICFLLLLFGWNIYENKFTSKYPLRWVNGVLLFAFLFTCGYSLILLHTPSENKTDISKFAGNRSDSMVVSIISIPQEKEKTIKATVEVKSMVINGKSIETSGKVLLYFHKDSNAEKLNYGDILQIYSRLNEIEAPSNPDEFDYREYLHTKGIYYEGYTVIHPDNILKSREIISLTAFANATRKKLVKLLDSNLGRDEASVASAILLGYREDLSKNVVQTFVDSGTVHVICVAGLHVGILFLLLGYIIVFPAGMKNGKLYRTLLMLILLWLYALFTGLATPVLRATIMFSFLTIGEHFRKYSNSINTLAASAFIMLVFDPFSLADTGFQLSYLSVLGIVIIYKPLLSIFEPGNRIIYRIWELVCVSASAQLAIFPLSLLYFHQFPNYFLFTNILIVPLLSIVLVCGIIFFLTSWIPHVSAVTGWILQKCLLLMNFIVGKVSHLPFSVSKEISVSTTEVVILYLFLGFFFLFIFTKRYKSLFIALSGVLIFTSFRVAKDVIHTRQQLFVVYNIPGKPAVSFISGKQGVMAFSQADSNDINFHISYHWMERGVRKISRIASDTDAVMLSGRLMLHSQFAQFNNLRLAFVRSNSDLPKDSEKISVETLVVSGSYEGGIENLKNTFTFDILIFDSSVSPKKSERWKEECEKLNLHYYDVRVQGAYIENPG